MNDDDLNERGNYKRKFSQGVGGWAEYQVVMTEIPDRVRHDVALPPEKVIPVIFLPGIMGSNLRMTKARKAKLKRPEAKAWRPDDLTSATGGASILFGGRRGGFFSSATPAERQLNFDPNETEVDYYQYTEDKGRFDPDGKETKESDIRHSNVPDGLASIPPLIMGTVGKDKVTKPAQIARWRGWSEVMFSGAYGNMLKRTEFLLNNILKDNNIHPCWQKFPQHFDGKPMLGVPHRELMNILLQSPSKFGAVAGAELDADDIRKVGACWYPVHAMGYNFLKSNGESAKVVAERIRGLVRGYQSRHFSCDEIIIVTHSMGGLLARAILHPKYGDLLNEKEFRVLGIYHSAMPTAGAGATYKRMRFGFQESWALLGETGASIFGIDGEHATAVLANASGPLELLPSEAYGKDWLKVINWKNEILCSWPRSEDTALDSIYLKQKLSWWRLVNPDWINPAEVPAIKGAAVGHVYDRLRKACDFVNSIKDTFHPSNTFASYCTSAERPCYGDVIFRVLDPDPHGLLLKNVPSVDSWKLVSDDKKGTLIVQAGAIKLTLRLQQPGSDGDETVPGKRSASRLPGSHFVHGGPAGKSYEHQNSYADNLVLASLLYSLIQIAKTAKWGVK